MTSGSTSALHAAIMRLPAVDDLSFWLAVNAIVMIYIGVSQLVLRYGPGIVFSAGAVFVGLVYAWFCRKRSKSPSKGDTELVFTLALLVILGDLVVTGALTTLSVLLDVTNLLLLFTAYKEIRPRTASQ